MIRAPLLAAVCVAATLAVSCTRDESGSEPKKPIESAFLPTPKTTVRVAQAIPPTPMPAHSTPAPSAPPTAAAEKPTSAPMPTAAATIVPKAEATTAPEKTEIARPAEAVTVTRKGIVGKGTDLLGGPSADAQVRGTFQGRTDVEVLETQGAFARVKAPVVGGGAVEGWVAASSVKAPGEKAPVVAKAAKPAAASGAGEAAKPATVAPKAAPAKPATAKGGGESKGPDDILLKALAGMAAKRPGTPFTHEKHYDDYSVKCVDCHHAVKAQGGAVPATKTCSDAGCHLADQCGGQAVPKKNAACPAFEDAYHMNCIECHRKQSGPTKCAECHVP